MRIALSSVDVPIHRVHAPLACQMPTSGRDNIIGPLKREPVANVTPDAVIGEVKCCKALFRLPDKPGTIMDSSRNHMTSLRMRCALTILILRLAEFSVQAGPAGAAAVASGTSLRNGKRAAVI